MKYQDRKNSAMGIIMSNPALSKQMREAWAAPAGSTKRSKARATMRSINKIGQRKGLYDGKGGAGPSVYNTNTAYGSTTPPVAQFANPRATGSTAPRLGTYGPTSFAPDVSTLRSRIIENVPEAIAGIGQLSLENFRLPLQNIPRAAGASLLKHFGFDTGVSTSVSEGTGFGKFFKSLDDIFRPYDGIGEVLVNDIAKHITGEDADKGELMENRNKTAREVRIFFENKAALKASLPGHSGPSTTYTTTGEGTLIPEGGVIDPITGKLITTPSSTTGSVAQNISDMIVDMFRTDREEYLNSLSDAQRPMAERLLMYADQGYDKETAVGSVTADLDFMQEAFPGVPAHLLPIGAFAEESVANLQKLKMKEYNIKEQYDKLFDMKSRGQYLEDDMIKYIKSRDNYISTIDTLLENESDHYLGRVMTPREQMMSNSYTNYLINIKGKQETRYIDWLERSSKEYERAYQMAADRFEKSTKMMEMELAIEEPLTLQRYQTYKKYIDGMYDQIGMMSSNQAVADAAKIEGLNRATNLIATFGQFSQTAKALSPYLNEEERRKIEAATGLNLAMANAGFSGLFGTNIDTTNFSTKTSDVQKAVGKYDKDGDFESLKSYNPVEIWVGAAGDETDPDKALELWAKQVNSMAYAHGQNPKTKYPSFMDDILKGMNDVRRMPEYTGNLDLADFVHEIRQGVMSSYVAAVEKRVMEDPREIKKLAIFVKKLATINQGDILSNPKKTEERYLFGKGVTTGAPGKSITSWGAASMDDVVDLIWETFRYFSYPQPNVHGDQFMTKMVKPNRVFLLGDASGKPLSDEDILKGVFREIKHYLTQTPITEAKATYFNIPEGTVAPESPTKAAEDEKAEALQNTMLGEIMK